MRPRRTRPCRRLPWRRYQEPPSCRRPGAARRRSRPGERPRRASLRHVQTAARPPASRRLSPPQAFRVAPACLAWRVPSLAPCVEALCPMAATNLPTAAFRSTIPISAQPCRPAPGTAPAASAGQPARLPIPPARAAATPACRAAGGGAVPGCPSHHHQVRQLIGNFSAGAARRARIFGGARLNSGSIPHARAVGHFLGAKLFGRRGLFLSTDDGLCSSMWPIRFHCSRVGGPAPRRATSRAAWQLGAAWAFAATEAE